MTFLPNLILLQGKYKDMGFIISLILSILFIWILGAYSIYLLIGSTIFGAITSIVASNKGRNAGWWFLIGYLCWLIGFIVALIISKDEESIESKSIQKGESRACPFCAETVKMKAKVCKHCGKDLPEISEKIYSSGRAFSVTKEGLFSAIRARDLGETEKIVNTNSSLVNQPDIDGLTPLHIAAIENQPSICSFLISKGANINAQDNSGQTANDYARTFNFIGVMEIFT